MTRVTMIVHNALEFDPRVEREAAALARAGYEVTVIGTWEPDRTERVEQRNGFTIRRVSRRKPGIDLVSRAYPPLVERAQRFGRRVRVKPLRAIERRIRRPIAKALIWFIRAVVRAIRRVLRVLPQKTQRWAIEARMMFAAVRTKPHVVHAHDLNVLAPGARAARLSFAKLVYDSHEISPGLPAIRDPERVIRFERKLITKADRVIHTTPMRAQWAADTYGIPVPTVVRNIPDVARDVRPVDLAAATGFPPGTKVILHQGNMQRDRGLEELIQAMAKLDDSYGLLLLGGGKMRGALEELVAERGLGARVKFHSSVPHAELLSWTAGAFCGVSLLRDTCLNHKYSLPNKLFESIAVGCPMVASNNPEIAAFVAEHGIGEVCDPDDPADIAAAIERLAARRDAAAASARAAGERFRWEHEETTLLDLYRGLVG